MKSISVEGLRCFRKEQHIPIRPITLLVGENSAGKSTVLAAIRAAWDVAFGREEPDFNEDPFFLGNYDSIAHFHGGQGKRAQEFKIHYEGTTGKASITGIFQENAGQAGLKKWISTFGTSSISIEFGIKEAQVSIEHEGKLLLENHSIKLPKNTHTPADVFFHLEREIYSQKSTITKSRINRQKISRVIMTLTPRFRFRHEPRPQPSAPIRSKPERTYDTRKDSPEPGGSHVPLRLAAMHATDPEEFRNLTDAFEEYGREAGLFKKLSVKRLGKKAGDPFQMFTTIDKYPFNIMDVGYGVSQVLPILFDTLAAPEGQTFLLQQPEVHLHPRAQAALGSLLVTQAIKRRQTFVVETHSDYLVDRVRMDVRDKKGGKSLTHKDVIILYFERKEGQVNVHPLEIDSSGNIVNPPQGYRDFFLREELRLLGMG